MPRRMIFEAVVACDLPEPCKFPSLDSCQKSLPWTHKGVGLVSHPVVGFVLKVGDVEKFPQAPSFEGLDSFLKVSKQCPFSQPQMEVTRDL